MIRWTKLEDNGGKTWDAGHDGQQLKRGDKYLYERLRMKVCKKQTKE